MSPSGRKQSLKIESQSLQNREVELTIEVPEERVYSAMQTAARRLAGRTRFPGFRPGKVPYDIVLRKFGEDAVFEEALESLGQEVYRQALDETKLDPYAPGLFDKVVTRSPLVLRYKVPLAPEVDLGPYKDLRIPFEAPTVEDQAVDEAMEDLRQRQALIEEAKRPAQLTDVVVLDVHGELLDPEEGKNPVMLDEHGISVLVDEATDFPVPGIVQHLLGLNAGEEKSFEFTFPEEHSNEGLRGRRARFQLTCQEVKSRLVPAWSDDLARSVGDFQDLLDLRIKVRQSLQDQATKRSNAEYADKVLARVVETSKISYPPVLLEKEIEDMVGELSRRLAAEKLSMQDYLKIEGKTAEQLRDELRPRAEERLQRALVLGKIVDLEGLDVEAEEIATEMDRLSAPWKESQKVRQALDNPTGRRRIALDLLTEKSVRRLVAIAKGEAESPAGEIPAPNHTSDESKEPA
jgi:trigger factor